MLSLDTTPPARHGPFPAHPYPLYLPGASGPFPAAGKPWRCRRVYRLPSGMIAINDFWCPPSWPKR